MKTSERIFGVLWRLTLFLLPWQMRWFHDAALGGWPWEQGRWSVYATMVLMVATILFGIDRKFLKKPRSFMPLVIGAAFILLTFFTTLSRVATAEWWIEVLILIGFVSILVRTRVNSRQVAAWFALGLIPQALLAIQQYLSGVVVASKWFGIAAHIPSDLGAIVIEHGAARILRAYGGFPHPNILGGWLAIGLVAVLQLAASASTKWRALFWSACGALFSAALIVSYSRSAWLAAAVGIILFVGIHIMRPVRQTEDRQFLFLALFAMITIAGAVVYSQRALVFSRADLSDRLEAKSVDVRGQSLRDGWKIFLKHPLFGAGPNAELVALAPACGKKCPAPLEPPHDVPLILLADVGLIGLGVMLAAIWWCRRRFTVAGTPVMATLCFLALFDHYLWSTWAGICLCAICFCLVTGDHDEVMLSAGT